MKSKFAIGLVFILMLATLSAMGYLVAYGKNVDSNQNDLILVENKVGILSLGDSTSGFSSSDEGILRYGTSHKTHNHNSNGCSSDSDCSPNQIVQAFDDYCLGYSLFDYNSNNILDVLLGTFTCSNTCNASTGLCSACIPVIVPPVSSANCVAGVCGANCEINSDCNDGNVLTQDLCTGCLCSNIPLGICGDAVDCDDGNVLTQDTCNGGICSNIYVGECNINSDCDDGLLITTDTCTNHLCSNLFNGECTTNLQCDDSNILTQDFCNNNFCEHNFIGECTTNPQCNDGNALTTDTCDNGFCQHVFTGTCLVDNDCDDSNPLTNDFCTAGLCTYNFIAECQIDADCNDGNVLTQDICNGGYCSNTLIARCAIDNDCNDGNVLTQDLCVNESCQNNFIGGCQIDSECNDNDGNTLDICNNGYCENHFIGQCVINSDCNDNNAFTNDICNTGLCEHDIILTECLVDADCDDNVTTTNDTCDNGYCSHAFNGLCTQNSQCNDGNPLTADSCALGVCVNNLFGECLVNADCNDADLCTQDSCNPLTYLCSNNPLADVVSYNGPSGTSGVGICLPEIQHCASNIWNIIQNERIPELEGSIASCSDVVDNDCDGLSDAGDNSCVDLRVSNLVVMYPANPSVGRSNTISFNIINSGFVPVTNILWNLNFGDGSFTSNSVSSALNPGQTITVSRFHTYTQIGNFTITSSVDSNNQINELNEANNIQLLPITVM